jgi:hypothetical protein
MPILEFAMSARSRFPSLLIKAKNWLKKLKLGFCMDKSLQEISPGVKPKDQYESMTIDPNADIPIDLILQKLAYYIDLIDK